MKPSIIVVILLSLLFPKAAEAQVVTVIDAYTHQPVVRASLYTKEGGKFHSAVTNEQGRARIDFTFSRLTISHLNYEKRYVKSWADTIRLKPCYQTTPEVTVTNREPEWIRRKLKLAVKKKVEHYFTSEATQPFIYDTQSTSKDRIYQYHLVGSMLMKSATRQGYAFVQDSATITASDSTSLTDTDNLRRMLYEDFMAELDNDFIQGHRFGENPAYKGRTSSEVELRFYSKSEKDDRGYLVIDTTRCIILSAYRFTGTKTNRKERLNTFMYAMARLMGYHIDTWTRDYRVTYAERPDGTLYPSEVRYKFYLAGRDSSDDKEEEAFREQTGGGFPNMEAVLTMGNPIAALEEPDSVVQSLPPSWYITFNSKADRLREVELANLPAFFRIIENE